MPTPVGVLVFALYGALMGSFANVVIWRVPRAESVVSPGSHCPACGTAIRWYDNVPVLSWIVLRARCRDCGGAISARYPLVEAASAVLWLSAALAFGASARGLVAAILFWALLILALVDLDTMRLPNAIVGPLAAFGLLAAAGSQLTALSAAPLIGISEKGLLAQPLAAALSGALLGAGVSLGIAGAYSGVRGRSGFGMGDVKLLGALGLFLGPYTLMVLVVASIVGAVVGTAASIRARESIGGARIPFGPFLAAGGVVTALYGPAAWLWYASLVGLA